jgi:hypothetical protein
MPKYVRILLSGFESASFPLANKPVVIPQNKTLIKKISLFQKHEINLDKKTVVLEGRADINGALYSGNTYPRIVGYGEFQDIGKTNEQGEFIASGTNLGKFLDNQYFTDKFGREIKPIEEIKEFKNSASIYKLNAEFTGSSYAFNGSYNPSDFTLMNSDVTQIIPPITSRYKTYTGIYSGTDSINGNFYYPEEFKVKFRKDINYVTTGILPWSQRHLIVREDSPFGGIAGITVLNDVLYNGSGFVRIDESGIITGEFINVGIPRGDIIGTAVITGLVTNHAINTFYYDDVVAGTRVTPARQVRATGFKNAYNYLIYNKPQFLDSVIIESSDNIQGFSYANEIGFYPPSYFNSLKTLNNIINSGSGTYGLISEIVRSGIYSGKALLLKSAVSGEDGNFIKITTQGSEGKMTLLNGEYLISGESYYPTLTPTGYYTGWFKGETLVTGYMRNRYDDFVEGYMDGIILGYRTFNTENPMWNMQVSPDNLYYLNLTNAKYKKFDRYKYTTELIEDSSINNYNITVGYNHQGNDTSQDEAELRVTLNNNILSSGIIIKSVNLPV